MKHVGRVSAVLSRSLVRLHRLGNHSGCPVKFGDLRLQATCVSATIDDAAKCNLRMG
jgi:hypothetical protein